MDSLLEIKYWVLYWKPKLITSLRNYNKRETKYFNFIVSLLFKSFTMDSLLEIKYWILYWKPNSLLVWEIRTREKTFKHLRL